MNKIVGLCLLNLLIIAGYYGKRVYYEPKQKLNRAIAQIKQLSDAGEIRNGDIIFQSSMSRQSKAIQIATYNAALDCRLQDVYGQILPGRVADLLIIDGDPSENISDIRKISTVIKNGRIYQPKQLLQSQGWKYYY